MGVLRGDGLKAPIGAGLVSNSGVLLRPPHVRTGRLAATPLGIMDLFGESIVHEQQPASGILTALQYD
jgi:hypothetical protein